MRVGFSAFDLKTRLGMEFMIVTIVLACNCILVRADTKELKAALGLDDGTPGVDVFTEVRVRKDKF